MSVSALADRRDAIDAAAAAIMVGLTFVWGLNQVAIKIGNTGFNPIALSCARSVLGGAIVYGWCLFRGVRLFTRDGSLWPGVLAGLLFGAEFIFIFFGLDYTTAAGGALMVNTMPFWVLIGAHFLLGERMAPRHVVGLILAFGGVTLIFADKLGGTGSHRMFLGDAMCLAGGVLWGATTLVIKRSKLRETSAEKLLLYQLSVSAVMTLPFVPLAGPLLRDVTALAVAAFLFQAVFVVGVTYIVWFWLMRRYPAAALASFTFLSPVFGVICSGLLLGEPIGLKVVGALVLIALGLVVVNQPARR